MATNEVELANSRTTDSTVTVTSKQGAALRVERIELSAGDLRSLTTEANLIAESLAPASAAKETEPKR